jgi:hypothetical protein
MTVDKVLSIVLSVIFGLAFGFGIAYGATQIYLMLTDEYSMPIVYSLIVFVTFSFLTYKAWRGGIKVLFIIMLVLSIPGYLALFGVTPESFKNTLTTQIDSATDKIAAATGKAKQPALLAVPPAAWQHGKDRNFVKHTKFHTGAETIDGQQKNVLTVEVNLPKGSKWIGGQVVLERTNVTIMSKLKQASGVRFSVLGDGKPWKLTFPMTQTEIDWCTHEYVIYAAKNSVTHIDIPYASLKQPTWGRQVSFNKDNITAVVLQRSTDSDFGTSTIKIFDFEIY